MGHVIAILAPARKDHGEIYKHPHNILEYFENVNKCFIHSLENRDAMFCVNSPKML
jgi:hypothetical protein